MQPSPRYLPGPLFAAVLLFLVLCLSTASARADFSDVVWETMRGSLVELTFTDGDTVFGELAGVGPDTVVIVQPDGEIAEVSRSAVVEMRRAEGKSDGGESDDRTTPPPSNEEAPAAATAAQQVAPAPSTNRAIRRAKWDRRIATVNSGMAYGFGIAGVALLSTGAGLGYAMQEELPAIPLIATGGAFLLAAYPLSLSSNAVARRGLDRLSGTRGSAATDPRIQVPLILGAVLYPLGLAVGTIGGLSVYYSGGALTFPVLAAGAVMNLTGLFLMQASSAAARRRMLDEIDDLEVGATRGARTPPRLAGWLSPTRGGAVGGLGLVF